MSTKKKNAARALIAAGGSAAPPELQPAKRRCTAPTCNRNGKPHATTDHAMHQEGVEEPPTCYICLCEAGPATRSAGQGLVRGCACRGTSGWAHLQCMVTAAMCNPTSWTDCPTCKQEYTGAVALGLARARDRQRSTLVTKNNLAAALTGRTYDQTRERTRTCRILGRWWSAFAIGVF